MFYSRNLLARKSPLGTVWIVAHLHHKLRKSQVVIDIASSVDCIMFPDVPIALRLSSHLLLGIVRIYSKKVDYLHHDCNEFLTQTRTTIASMQVNLPEDASHAPFHAVTLPETFELDALNLDDAIHQIETPDDHLKTWNEITMTDQIPGEGDPYVAFFIDEDIRMDAFPQGERSNHGLVPMEKEDNPSSGNNDVDITDARPSNHAGQSNQKLHEDNVSQEFPETEVLRDAVEPLGVDNLKGWPEFDDNIVEPQEPFDPTMNQKEKLTPIMEGFSVSGGESLPSPLHPMPPTNRSVEEPEIFNSRNSFGPTIPEMALQPTPPIVPEMALQPTPPIENNQVKSRKRKQPYDEDIVLSNQFMRNQVQDASKLVRKRKKLPLSALDVWRSRKRLQRERIFLEPSIFGMCSHLQEVFKKSFIASQDNQVPTEALPEQRSAELPAGMTAFDMEIEQPRFEDHADAPLPDYEQPTSGKEVQTPILASNLGSDSQTEKHLEPEVLLTPDLPTFAEPSHLEPETPMIPLEEELPEGGTNLPQIPEIMNSANSPLTTPRKQQTTGDSYLAKNSDALNFPESEELSFLDTEVTPTGHQEKEFDSLTVRTRRMAQYLKDQSPSTEISGGPSGHLSLNKILEGETRKRCARMFYEALVLKTCEFIDVHQDEAYGDITLSLTPSLLKAKL